MTQQATSNYLSVGVFNGGDVGLAKSALDESQDEGTFADATCSKHHHSVVVALFRHSCVLSVLGADDTAVSCKHNALT